MNRQWIPGRASRTTRVAGLMNKTEERYAAHLETRKMLGEIRDYAFEAIKLRLAHATFYTPDFFVQLPTGELECHEVKAFWEDDARVKVKVAAQMFPFRFVAITERPRKQGGGYVVEEF